MKTSRGFTLIELLVVMAILGVLAAATVIVINPVELLAQSRDAERISDIQALSKSIALYQIQNPGDMPGSTSTIYLSLNDTSSTCGSWSLPALPSGWSYGCSTNPKRTDGTGWIPSINFGTITSNSISSLPVDPINSPSNGLYYTYVISGNQYELTSLMESLKYRQKEETNPPLQDYPGVLAEGNNLSISPLFSPSGLIGYWNFDEGSGTTAHDASGNNNDGTFVGSPSWVSGKLNSALSFTSTSHVEANDPGMSNLTSFTIAAWVKYITIPNAYPAIVTRNPTSIWDGSMFLVQSNSRAGVQTGNSWAPGGTTLSPGIWYQITATYDGTVVRLYVNGVKDAQYNYSSPLSVESKVEIGSANGSYWFNGSIDDVRIYNRALSVSEVQALYNSQY